MIDKIKSALGFGTEIDYLALKEAGALVVDVRSKAEFQSGHAKNAINIPLDQVEGKIKELKRKNKPIITCCVSGARSGAAKRKLQAAGIEKVYNGGNWSSLDRKLSSL